MGIHIMPPLYKLVIPKKVTETFYPDAHPESKSVDGWVEHEAANSDWPIIRGGAGTGADDTGIGCIIEISSSPAEQKWLRIRRAILLFDTASLPPGAVITRAVLSVYVIGWGNTLGISPAYNVYTSNPASDTALVAGDFNSLGTTPLSSEIDYADIDQLAYNDFVLNATGRALISKTGITKLGIRESNYDAPDNEPTWGGGPFGLPSFITIASSDHAEAATERPKLTVTYEL